MLESLKRGFPSTDSVRLEVFDFLSMLCNVGTKYYKMVVEAMEAYKFQKREPMRFYEIVQALQHDENSIVRTRALQLINRCRAVICVWCVWC